MSSTRSTREMTPKITVLKNSMVQTADLLSKFLSLIVIEIDLYLFKILFFNKSFLRNYLDLKTLQHLNCRKIMAEPCLSTLTQCCRVVGDLVINCSYLKRDSIIAAQIRHYSGLMKEYDYKNILFLKILKYFNHPFFINSE